MNGRTTAAVDLSAVTAMWFFLGLGDGTTPRTLIGRCETTPVNTVESSHEMALSDSGEFSRFTVWRPTWTSSGSPVQMMTSAG